jgi:PAS domain S-box-containing protein
VIKVSENKFLIALIDDDVDQTFLAKKALTDFMSLYEVDVFYTGKDFFDRIKGNPNIYDALVVDYMLPQLNGLEILHTLHGLQCEVPIIFLTVSDDKDTIHEALNYGAYDYLLKIEGYLSTLPVILLKSIDKYQRQKHREEVQKKVQTLKEYFENILNTIPYAVIGINQMMEISYANSECQNFFFVDPSELIGQKIMELFDPEFLSDISLIDHIKKVSENSEHISFSKISYINRKNQKKHLDIDLLKTSSDYGDHVLLLINDITRNVELEQKLIQTEKLASLGKLLTGITHELNNRLGPVLAYTQLLMTKTTDQRSLNWMKNIEDSAQSMKSIIESLLYFSPGTTRQHKESICINDLINNTLTLLNYKFQSKNIKITKKLSTAITPLFIDQKQISKVLLNILNNSYEAMELTGGELYISSKASDNMCIVSIVDTGNGIPEDIQSEIFDPFFTTKSNKDNVGLGLSIAYTLLESHNGSIKINTKANKGTEVTISIPFSDSASAAKRENNLLPASEQSASQVLIIEDDETLRDVMKDILEETYSVDIAENGLQAKTRISQKNYNAILADIRMPGMDGPSLFYWIRDNFPGLEKKMVFTTGDTYDPETNKFLDSIDNDYLAKPFNINDLRNIIKQVIA